jgi:protein transport protein SEC24
MTGASVMGTSLIGYPTDVLSLARSSLVTPPKVLGASKNPASELHVCPVSLQRSTLNVVPQSYSVLNKTKIPFGLVIDPFKNLEPHEVIPVIGSTNRKDYNQPVFSSGGIIRCRRCRAYINPYIEYVDTTHWRCNICFLVGEIPTYFDFDVQTQQYVDRNQRPELKYACVEYVASNEYMVRPPPPVVLVFVIDVSFTSVSTGVVAAFAQCLLDTLDSLPNEDNRTRVGFIAVDSAVHFFSLEEDKDEPTELVVSDLDDVFLPMPNDLLVNLTACRPAIENLLQKLPDMYKHTVDNKNCLGAALQAAMKLMAALGGKIVVLQASLPSVGPGQIKMREEPKMLGTQQENALLQPQSSFFKGFAIDGSRIQACVDLFFFGNQYLDLATLTGASRFTGGMNYYYPGFNASRIEDVMKFSSEFSSFISQGNLCFSP